MKAHIARTPKIALAWNLDAASAAALAAAAAPVGMQVKPVTPDHLGEPIAQLCGLPLPRRVEPFTGSGEEFPGAVLFCGLSDAELDRVLSGLRGVKIPLKATSTPTNQGWALGRLLGELMAERAAFAAGQAAHPAP